MKQGVQLCFHLCTSISPYDQKNAFAPPFLAEDMQSFLVPAFIYSFEDKMGQKIQFCP